EAVARVGSASEERNRDRRLQSGASGRVSPGGRPCQDSLRAAGRYRSGQDVEGERSAAGLREARWTGSRALARGGFRARARGREECVPGGALQRSPRARRPLGPARAGMGAPHRTLLAGPLAQDRRARRLGRSLSLLSRSGAKREHPDLAGDPHARRGDAFSLLLRPLDDGDAEARRRALEGDLLFIPGAPAEDDSVRALWSVVQKETPKVLPLGVLAAHHGGSGLKRCAATSDYHAHDMPIFRATTTRPQILCDGEIEPARAWMNRAAPEGTVASRTSLVPPGTWRAGRSPHRGR